MSFVLDYTIIVDFLLLKGCNDALERRHIYKHNGKELSFLR